MNRKKSFILFADYIIHVNRLPDEAAGRLFKGILQYAKEGIDPQFPPTADAAADAAVDMAFSFIKLQISRDVEKYEAVSQRRAEAGRLGGLKTQANKRKQMLANEADNDIMLHYLSVERLLALTPSTVIDWIFTPSLPALLIPSITNVFNTDENIGCRLQKLP